MIILLILLHLLMLYVRMLTYLEPKLFPFLIFHNGTFGIIKILIVLEIEVSIYFSLLLCFQEYK
jgi:hypothetical protein